MTKVVTTEFPTGLGSRNQNSEPVTFKLEWRSIEGFAADLRNVLSKYDISDNVLVDINTLTDHNGTIRLDNGSQGMGTYQVVDN